MCTEPGPDKPTRDTWLGRCHGALRSPGRRWPVSALCIKLSPCPSPGTRLEETKRGHFSKDVNSTRLHNRAGDRPQGSWPPPCARGALLSDVLRSPVASPALEGLGAGTLGGVRQPTEPWEVREEPRTFAAIGGYPMGTWGQDTFRLDLQEQTGGLDHRLQP